MPAAGVKVPAVLLWHTRADGTEHLDLLIARDRQGVLPLLSFRLPIDYHDWPVGFETTLEQVPDHRPIYLHFEGWMSGGRGIIDRVATGTAAAVDSTRPAIQLRLNWIEYDWKVSLRLLKPREKAAVTLADILRAQEKWKQQGIAIPPTWLLRLERIAESSSPFRWQLRVLSRTMADDIQTPSSSRER